MATHRRHKVHAWNRKGKEMQKERPATSWKIRKRILLVVRHG